MAGRVRTGRAMHRELHRRRVSAARTVCAKSEIRCKQSSKNRQKIEADGVFARQAADSGMLLIMVRFPRRRAHLRPLGGNCMNKSTLGKIVLTAAVAVGGVGFLVKSSVSSAQHYMMVHELMGTDLTSWTGKGLKGHGFVEAGSIHESVVNQETHRTFLL